MDISLCILARGGAGDARKLTESIRSFRGLDVEVVVGDNSREESDRAAYEKLADVYVEVSDQDLWYDGFGPAKQRLAKAASCDWVAIGDVGEIWHEYVAPESGWLGLAYAVAEHPDCPCFRTCIGNTEEVSDVARGKSDLSVLGQDHGRVFDKRRMRLLGLIHEAPFERRTGVIWSAFARRHGPVALVEHQEKRGDSYDSRKRVLYDHLLDTICRNPDLRAGTDPWWFETYWPRRLQDGWEPITFDEWKAMKG